MGMRWGQATTEGFVEKPTSREGDMAGREGNEWQSVQGKADNIFYSTSYLQNTMQALNYGITPWVERSSSSTPSL